MQSAYVQIRPLQGVKRRLIYVGLYEAIAILLSTLLLALMNQGPALDSLGVAVAASAVAIVWNLLFNTLFERWEQYHSHTGRSLGKRLLHALGFEGGLLLFLVPLLAWWYSVSVWQALLMDMALLVFFLFYTLVFTWAFDRVFGLPGTATATI